MKKFVICGLVGLLAGSALMAQSVPAELTPQATYEITGIQGAPYEGLMNKIQHRQRIDIADVPAEYNWYAGEGHQLDKNIFYSAKKVYEQYPNSFNAAYNYGVLIYYMVQPEIGLVANMRQLDEAYIVFEKAKKINPNEEGIYRHQIILLQQKILHLAGGMEEPGGFAWDKYSRAIIQDENYHWLARQLLDNITQLFQLRGIINTKGTLELGTPVSPDLLFQAWSAYEICQALNLTEEALAWKALAQRWDAESAQLEKTAAKKEAIARREAERDLKRTLRKIVYWELFKNIQRPQQ